MKRYDSNLFDSPTVLLATLFAARRSGDSILEKLMQRRLVALGIQVEFTKPVTSRASRCTDASR